METTLTLPSPAKVNRFLHIVGRRSDGYHLLQTVFQFLDYGDTLRFAPRLDGNIVLEPESPHGIPLHTNLIYRAAKALQTAARTHQGATIHIDKQLPLGGGLGGGSSNAATTLWGLNWLWGLGWSEEALMPLGLALGADIPVFIKGQSAWAEGIGEKLTPLPLDEPWFLVIIPPCQVNTSKIYADPNLTRDTPTLKMEALVREGLFSNFLNKVGNDFEPLVRQRYPEVDEAMKWFQNKGSPRLSGSGASIFLCFSSKAQADKIAQDLPKNVTRFVARGANVSPLLQVAKTIGVSPSGKAQGFDPCIPRFES